MQRSQNVFLTLYDKLHIPTLMDQSISGCLAQTNKDSPHPTTQSGPDSQTARPLARNNATSYNAARFLHHNTGFEVGTVDVHPYKPARPFSDDPRRCIRRTIRDCRECRSSRAECRLGRCGNS